jgi:hypothetical protein
MEELLAQKLLDITREYCKKETQKESILNRIFESSKIEENWIDGYYLSDGTYIEGFYIGEGT